MRKTNYCFNDGGYLIHCVKIVQIRSLFWSVFSCTRTKHGNLRSKSPYSVQIQENTDQKKLGIWTLFTQLLAVVISEELYIFENNLLSFHINKCTNKNFIKLFTYVTYRDILVQS